MSYLRRAAGRFVVGSLLAGGTAVGLAATGVPTAFAVGAGAGVGVVVGRVLFGKSPVPLVGD